MSASTRQVCDADLPSAHLLPPSSPIDGFGSPSLLALPPPADRNSRSQSSSAPPRLNLASSRSMSQSQSTRRTSLLRPPSVVKYEEEEDELDEEPLELDSDEFEKLEADGLRMATQQRGQPMTATETVPSSSTLVPPSSSQKRSISELVDPSEASLEPSTQPRRRRQDRVASVDDVPLTPFFQQEWMQDLMSQGKGPRPSCPVEPDQTGGICEHFGWQGKPIVIDDTCVPQPASRKPGISVASASSTTPSDRKRARKSQSHDVSTSGSDDDVPLASISALNGAADEISLVSAAVSQLEGAIADFIKAHKDEMDVMKSKVLERDFLIDTLRAQLRTRPSN